MEQEKKYLKTLEELRNALDSGNTVYGEDAGIRIRKSENGSYFYEDKTNCERFTSKFLFLPVPNKLYKLEPKPLEVKLWHLYEDKNGDKVLIISHCAYPSLGKEHFIGIKNKKDYENYDKYGKSEGSSDLVKEIADLYDFIDSGRIVVWR